MISMFGQQTWIDSDEMERLATHLLGYTERADETPHLIFRSKKSVYSEYMVDDSLMKWVDSFTDPTRGTTSNNNSVRLSFDSVDSFSVSYDAKLTNHLMNNGTTAHDNYQLGTPKFSFSGHTSDIATNTQYIAEDVAMLLQEAWASKLPMYLYLPDVLPTQTDPMTGRVSNSTVYHTVYITKCDIKRDTNTLDGFVVNLSLEQPSFYNKIKEGDPETIVTVADNTKSKESKTGTIYYKSFPEADAGRAKAEADNKKAAQGLSRNGS